MKIWIKIVLEIYLLIMIITISYFIGAISGDDLQKKVIESTLKKEFIKKNLSFIDEKKFLLNTYYSQEDFETYNDYFQSQYKYDVNGFDCKASSLNWASYLYKHNIEYKYVSTENHIMVLAYNDEGYCLFSNNNSFCEGMKLK